MIYYYFGGKEQLFIAVLERAYSQLRDAEQTLDVDHLDPLRAIRELAELTFDHHERHPEFLRLVAIENIHRAEHIKRSSVLTSINTRAVDLIARILRRGREQGAIRRDVDPLGRDLRAMLIQTHHHRHAATSPSMPTNSPCPPARAAFSPTHRIP